MSKTKVLVVDDEEDFQDIVRHILERAGYEVVVAGDGGEGLAALRREKPDLLILDINMPLKDGYVLCREARAMSEFAELPILMLTIRNRDEEIVRGMDVGADAYLAKPFDPGELLARLRTLLKRS